MVSFASTVMTNVITGICVSFVFALVMTALGSQWYWFICLTRIFRRAFKLGKFITQKLLFAGRIGEPLGYFRPMYVRNDSVDIL